MLEVGTVNEYLSPKEAIDKLSELGFTVEEKQ